jgi:hypothetical protein
MDRGATTIFPVEDVEETGKTCGSCPLFLVATPNGWLWLKVGFIFKA